MGFEDEVEQSIPRPSPGGNQPPAAMMLGNVPRNVKPSHSSSMLGRLNLEAEPSRALQEHCRW